MTESEILQYQEDSRKTDEKYTKIISDFHLEDRTHYWIKENEDYYSDMPEQWKLSRCSIGIESSHLYGNAGLIYMVHFDVIGSDSGYDYEDIILGPKIEIGEPPQ